MYLRVLHHGQRPHARFVLAVIRAIGRMEPDAVARTSLYRPAFFGRHFLRLTAEVLRGPSDWSPGERELFAALVSQLNQCPFCTQVHAAMVRIRFSPALDSAQIARWREQPLDARVAAGLDLVEKVTMRPENLGPEDIRRANAGGLSDAAIADALHVAFVFNLINRVANAFGFDWGGEANARKGAAILNRMAYRVPAFLLR